MTFDHNHLLLAQATEQAPAPAADPAAAPDGEGAQPKGPSMLPIFVLMFVIMYFLMIRPQQKRAKEHKQRIESLKIGSKVISAGGIHGLVTNISDKTVTVKVSDNSKIKFEKASITQVFGGKDDTADSGDDAAASDEAADSSDDDKA